MKINFILINTHAIKSSCMTLCDSILLFRPQCKLFRNSTFPQHEKPKINDTLKYTEHQKKQKHNENRQILFIACVLNRVFYNKNCIIEIRKLFMLSVRTTYSKLSIFYLVSIFHFHMFFLIWFDFFRSLFVKKVISFWNILITWFSNNFSVGFLIFPTRKKKK